MRSEGEVMVNQPLGEGVDDFQGLRKIIKPAIHGAGGSTGAPIARPGVTQQDFAEPLQNTLWLNRADAWGWILNRRISYAVRFG